MIIRLPWPPKELKSNARLHWRALWKAKKAYKDLCAWELIDQGVKRMETPPERLFVTMTFYPPANFKYDQDGLIARMKYGLDMIAQRLQVDDYTFVMSRPIVKPSEGKPGHVIVQIKETDE